MKKLLLVFGLLLITATAASAQYGPEWEWQTRVTKVYQCNYGSYNKASWLPFNGPSYECLDVRGKLDPYDPTPGYLLNQKYVQNANALDLTNRIVVCGYKWLLAPDYKTEWSVEYWTFDTCPAAYTKIDLGLRSLKQQAPGTSEVFLCRNTGDKPINYITKDPNCRRPGYAKVASLGFWPQNQDFTIQPPAPTPTPAPPIVAPPVAVPEEEICCMIVQDIRGQKRIEIEKSTKTRCEEQAKRAEGLVETKTIPMEQCRQKVCCERKEERNSMEYRECIRDQGKVVEIPLEQCKKEKPPVQAVQAPIVAPPVDCAAIIKENQQLRKQRDDLKKKRDQLNAMLKPVISPPPSKGVLESCRAGECKQGLTCFASRCVTLILLYQCDIKPAFSTYWYDTDPRCIVPGVEEGDVELSKTGTKIGYLTKEDPYQEISKTPEGYYASPSRMMTRCLKGERQQASNMALRAREYLVSLEKGYPICPPDTDATSLGYAYDKNIKQKTTSSVIPLGEGMWSETFIIPLDYKEPQ